MGSSPLTRGKQRIVDYDGEPHGLIPAHAGKTVLDNAEYFTAWAHPRSRGENDVKTGSGLPVLGSSPLTRGKHVEVAGFGVFGHGSSPLTRGKQDVDREATTGPRLIPAHAGKTIPTNRRQYLSGAHPRSRGENLGLRHARVEMEGSSPLTRGKLLGPKVSMSPHGLIPAHAGKTSAPHATAARSWAHPRSRGENHHDALLIPGDPGSSPLTRGKRLREQPQQTRHGLIPAHAGKTAPAGERIRGEWAHPRSRGENKRKPPRRRSSTGSSPLTRGKLPGRTGHDPGARLIPAHAGKTSRHRE